MRRRPVAALLLLVLGCTGAAERFRPLAVGDRVPEYAVRTLAGDTARVGMSEPLTLLNVWATWCVPCQKEFPDLEQLHRDYAREGLRVLAVSVDDGDDEAVRRFVAEKGSTFPVAHDPAGRISELYQLIGVPQTFLISPDGRLLWKEFTLPAGAASARAAVERALRGE